MEITDVKVRKILNTGKLRGIISITLDDVFAVHDIKVIEGDNRLFVAMPSRRDEQGDYRDIVHPITKEARGTFENVILDKFNEAVEQEHNQDTIM